MKLSDIRPNIETSGELEEQFFSIQDQGMIFDILRNKMYSNSILAICREISCNARDAHREVGKEDVPVEITLPTVLEPTYKIKDFGPGISPSRMANVFVKYTASTKRSDNLQTGGFGLGAKTPFSYSDSFNIITCVDGVRYDYACFIDEIKVGKLALLSEAPTIEPNGTTISIPAKPADFNLFRDYTEQATRHWKVRPLIKGGKVNWVDLKVTLKGVNWIVATDAQHWVQHELKLIVDGIEYPVDLSTLRKYADCKLIDACRGSLYLYFGVGELSLSASRESVHLDKATQDKIATRLAEVTSEIHKNVETKIEQFPNFWEANLFYIKDINETFSNIAFLGKLKWRGIELFDNQTLNTGTEVFHFSKHYPMRHKWGTKPSPQNDEFKLRRNRDKHIRFEEHSRVVLNDLAIKEPTPRHVKKAFEDDPTLVSLQLVCPSDTVTKQILIDKLHLDQMNYLLLSDLTKATGRTNKPVANKLLVFKLDAGSGQFRLSSYNVWEEDTNTTKVLCLLKKDDFYHQNRFTCLKNGKQVPSDVLYYLSKQSKDVSIYGVDIGTEAARIDEDFQGFTDIDTFIDKSIVNNKNIDFVALKYANRHRWDIKDRFFRHKSVFEMNVKSQKSAMLKYLNSLEKLKELLTDENCSLLQCYEQLGSRIDDKTVDNWELAHPELNLSIIGNELEIKYPLIKHLNDHSMYDVMPLVDYVNFMDSK